MARSKTSTNTTKTFTVGWLYPDLMNIYGDRGNIITLLKRAEWRGYDARLLELGRGTTQKMADVDVFFFGGGQDREQALVYEDLLEHKQPHLESAVSNGAQILAVCGGYQLLGHYYQTAEGERFPGIGLIDVRTEAGKRRFIGDVVVDTEIENLTPSTLVGFENHSGHTFLGPKAGPLGKVRIGFGNNGSDSTEGCVQGAVIGTYLHGSLLPKNPHLADHLLKRALSRRGVDDLSPLDDSVEFSAHERILERAQRRPPARGPRADQPKNRSSGSAPAPAERPEIS
jgi:CobQ-like glutamine amidotransferase family enzyme